MVTRDDSDDDMMILREREGLFAFTPTPLRLTLGVLDNIDSVNV